MSQRYLGGIITANPTTPTMTSESGVWTLEQQFQYNTTWSPKIVGNSLRFRSSASAYLSRTPASASNRTTWTWSGWVKRGGLGATGYCLFGAGPASNTDFFYFGFEYSGSADQIVLIDYPGSSSLDLRTTQVFRDPSAWYHVVLAVDTTQATSSNRVKLYVNGVQVTAFGTATYPSQNAQTRVNSTNTHYVGAARFAVSPSSPFDGYIAEINFIDGQALTPSSFGAYDSTGTWQPLPYTGTYGTNGFYLTFADNSAATAAALGKDTSGNGNNWTPNNISLTAGTTYDWMLDSPTNFPNASTGIGNYAVLNPTSYYYNSTSVTNGNLQMTGNAAGAHSTSPSTIAVSSGKWYAEFTLTAFGGNYPQVGILSVDANLNNSNPYIGLYSNGYAYWSNGNKCNNAVNTSYGATFTTNDVIGVAYDADAGTLTFYKNGSSQGTAYSGLSGTFYFAADAYNAGSWVANFGQRPFTYTPPSGFKALNTLNLPDPNITNGAQYMAATTYSGDSTYPRTITNGGNNTLGTTFKPDFVWQKARSTTYDHILYDSVRGTGTGASLASNSTAAEGANAIYANLTAYASNGFTVGSTSATNVLNNSGQTYVAWQWQAGQGTTSSNTNGSITSTVSVNATAGFSVVTYTGNGSTGTVGHSLGVAPSMIIVKVRSTTNDWGVGHASVGWNQAGLLNLTNSFGASSYFNSTSPTSTVFSVGASANTNTNGATYVAYCWAAVAGYSAFGSYTGNGSTDGPFVYLGFRPRWLMVKPSSSTGSWLIHDTARDTYNVSDLELQADTSSAEYNTNSVGAGDRFDILSNGFKNRSSNAGANSSGVTYVFAAFAENPFKISRAR